MNYRLISGRQISAARSLLGLHQTHLAAKTSCTRSSISVVERGMDLPVKGRIVAFLEGCGVEFIRNGVRLRVAR